ncbi:putative hydro-lyase [Streptomyces sp. MA25(2023)]|uniref:putative hydro-lyase n=1 Tax=Streptomyces sp. MA25(2023) TaxID=3055078 RepID=UPI0025B19D00|nr:putative hydro-lyase [Streptomyces sp. MA25(2023)]MDN3257215.1 putative hydro-lyase [Streptomyces sp. MA25(2023)]
MAEDRPVVLVDEHAHAWSPKAARSRFRKGLTGPTAGVSAGHTQANLIAVPADWAYDMLLFCTRNPQPCPVLDVTDAGSWTTALAEGADLRTDLPRYRVWRDGELVDEPTDVREHWRDDLVSFLIGCSFTFEWALTAAGVPVRHVEQGRNVPMFVTTRQCRPAGRLRGPMVVSMRPVPPAHLDAAIRETGLLPAVHGSPVHCGDPSALGIVDLGRPDFGDAVRAEPDEIPVFWACGVTPQAAAVVDGVLLAGGAPPVLGLPGSRLLESAGRAGLPVVPEAFADRAYTDAGTLVPRGRQGAVISDPDAVVQRSVGLAVSGTVTARSGARVEVRARSLYVHGDTPGAVELARRVRRRLEASGVRVEAFA